MMILTSPPAASSSSSMERRRTPATTCAPSSMKPVASPSSESRQPPRGLGHPRGRLEDGCCRDVVYRATYS
jgi:hypothetical protein